MSLETVTQMAKSPEKAKKPEKSQAELRAILEQKLITLKSVLQEGIREYEQAMKDGVFEDEDEESKGSGETRKETMQKKLADTVNRAERMKQKLDSKEILPQTTPEISASYTHPDGKKETITIELEANLEEFLSFYKKTGIDLPPDFEDAIRDIWDTNQTEIEEAIEQNGFNDILVIPATQNIEELKDKMTMEKGYYTTPDFNKEGGFASVVSPNRDKPRLILVHDSQNLKDRPELKQTLNIKGQDVKLDQALSLEDYIIFQRKYFEETGKHLDEDGWTWLSSKAGARLVYSDWIPGNHRLRVSANILGFRDGSLWVRPSRCFF